VGVVVGWFSASSGPGCLATFVLLAPFLYKPLACLFKAFRGGIEGEGVVFHLPAERVPELVKIAQIIIAGVLGQQFLPAVFGFSVVAIRLNGKRSGCGQQGGGDEREGADNGMCHHDVDLLSVDSG